MFLGKNYIIQLFVCQSSCSNVFLSNKGRYFRHKSKLNNRGKADFYCFFIFSYFLMVFIGMISFIKLFTLSILFIISLRQQYMKKYLNKQLTKQQDQAYEGAKCFYNYVLPMFIAIAFIVQSFYILKEIYIGNNVLIYQLDLWIDTYLYALFAAITYYLASIFYNKCHEIDTTALTTLLIRDSQLLIQQSQEQQDTLLDKQKPNKHYCKICLIVCDYRTKHCRKCQVCIQTYDHHCFWLGNCVGRYNYKEFYFFLLLQSANNYFTLVIMHRLNEHFQINIYVYIFRLVGMLMALGFLCFTGYLSLYHTILISCGMTTWQHMRRSSISYLKYLPIGYNPFSLGFYQNWKKFITQNESRQLSKHKQWQQYLPSFQQSKYIEPSFNLIQNEYYSCC